MFELQNETSLPHYVICKQIKKSTHKEVEMDYSGQRMFMPTQGIVPHLKKNMINSTVLILIRFIKTNVENPACMLCVGNQRKKRRPDKNAQRE